MEFFRGEIKERLNVPVFSGETQENFMLGAVIQGNEVFYDKTKLPRPARPEIYADKINLFFPFDRALIKAKELGHKPLIIEGSISRFTANARNKNDWVEFPVGYLLPVTALWIPRNDTVWREQTPYDKTLHIPTILRRIPAQEFIESIT